MLLSPSLFLPKSHNALLHTGRCQLLEHARLACIRVSGLVHARWDDVSTAAPCSMSARSALHSVTFAYARNHADLC